MNCGTGRSDADLVMLENDSETISPVRPVELEALDDDFAVVVSDLAAGPDGEEIGSLLPAAGLVVSGGV